MGKVRLVVFDMAGTTVDDNVNGVPLVLKSYRDAFYAFGVKVSMEVLNEQRGRDKWTVISELGGEKAPRIYEHFLKTLEDNVSKVKEIEGASETFKFLMSHGVRVIASTGFPMDIADAIIKQLGWIKEGLIDTWICSEQVGVSRPNPKMILHAMKQFGFEDPRLVVKVDDTAKGIEEGLNAGVITVGVLTGTQSVQRLEAAAPDTILRSVKDLPDYLIKKGYL